MIATIPRRMFNLPRDARGFPIPWFAGPDIGTGRDFVFLDGMKQIKAVERRRCWTCGGPLQRSYTFVLGPVQTITRTVSEPPSHSRCAEYAAKVCPFLSNPAKGRLTVANSHGAPINPGVFALWRTLSFEYGDRRGTLIVGDPVRVAWWTRGRPATKAEVEAALAVARRYCSDEN
jgi:hypothetical protein